MLKVVINKDYRGSIKNFVSKLPQSFENGGEIIEDSRNTIKAIDFEGMKLNAKAFKIPHLLNQFVYANFRESKAKRSYQYAKMLEEKGVNTPIPLAYIEEKNKYLLKNSMFISEHMSFDGEMRVLSQGGLEEHKNLIKQFAVFTASLHNKGILHLDYSSGNILFKKTGDRYLFYLVDLNRMKFDQSITIKLASHNFRRLWGNDEMMLYFARKYAQNRNFNPQKTQNETMKQRTKFWKRFNRKYPDAVPYIG